MTTYYVRKSQENNGGTTGPAGPAVGSGLWYWFDGSDAAAADPGGVWTGETNADDMDISTVASTSTMGNSTSNYLLLEGTNAPASGSAISSVELYVYFGPNTATTTSQARVDADGAVQLETNMDFSETTSGWRSSTSNPITAPGGGWTWAAVQALEVRLWTTTANLLEIGGVMIRVVTTDVGQSAANPFYYVDDAANVVAAGDTVYVGAGTYREAVTMDTSGSSGNQITYVADVDGSQTGDPGLVVISAYTDSNTVTRTLCWDPDGRTFVTVRGFVMQGGTLGVVWDANTTNQNYEGVIFEDCVFVAGPDGADEGMRLDANQGTTPTADGLTVRRCMFQGAGIRYQWDGNATADQNLKVVIEDCLFVSSVPSTSTGGSGIQFDLISSSTFASGGVTIRNCTILGFGNGIGVDHGTSVTYPVTVTNCYVQCWNYGVSKGTSNDGAVVGDYNTFHNITPYLNVTPGANDRLETSTVLLGGIADMPLYRFLGWSPYKPWEPMRNNDDTDWTSLIGDATTGPAVDLYNNPRPMAQAGTARSIYFFDASDAGPTDDEGSWTNDANAFNGNISDFATNSATGSSTNNELRGTGTNAPNPSGGVVYSVRHRAYVTTPTGAASFNIEYQGSPLNSSSGSTTDGWIGWISTTAPAGGWTWAKVQALEVIFWSTNDTAFQVHAAEIEVTHSAQLAPDRGAVEGRARPERETTTIDTGSTAVRFEGAGYHDMMFPVAAASTTVTVKARKDANYTGTAPQLVVMNIPGVADQTDTHAVAADTWDTLTVTFTPTSAGVARIRLLSSDTSATGRSFFDTLTVS